MSKKRRYKKRRGKSLEHVLFDAFSLPFRFVFFKLMHWLLRPMNSSIGKRSLTLQGEEVKSVAEKRVANYLFRHHIEYVYEKPLRVWFFTKVHPDFYLPQYNVYIEYYGLLAHKTKGKKYRRERVFKERHYARLGVVVINLDHTDYAHIEKSLADKLRIYRT